MTVPARAIVGGAIAAVALTAAGCQVAPPAPFPAGPTPFAPAVLAVDREPYRITFTPSGDTAYFAAGHGFFPQTRQATIYYTVRADGEWQPPVVAPFSGEFPDIDPFVTPDGRFLYFSSIRPVDGAPADRADLWRVERQADGWGEPARVAASSPHDDLFPSVDVEGNLYFGSARPHPSLLATWNIWVAQRDGPGKGAPEPLGPGVNAPGTWQFNPAVSPTGNRLVFTRLDPTDAANTGFGELHVSFRRAGDWSSAASVGPPVNTAQDEYHPSFSPDGAMLFFVRRDPRVPDATGALLAIPVSALGNRLLPPP